MGKTKNVIIVVVLVAIVVGYFFYLSNYEKTEDSTVITAVDEVILRDLETNYPPTPKEIVKYYSEITKCLHNEKYTEEQFEKMADHMLKLYDEELLLNNPREQYLVELKEDIKEFVDAGYVINTYTTSTSTDVETFKMNGKECAKLYCTFSIKNGAEYTATKEVFILRKDSDGHWKIYGFDSATVNE